MTCRCRIDQIRAPKRDRPELADVDLGQRTPLGARRVDLAEKLSKFGEPGVVEDRVVVGPQSGAHDGASGIDPQVKRCITKSVRMEENTAVGAQAEIVVILRPTSVVECLLQIKEGGRTCAVIR